MYSDSIIPMKMSEVDSLIGMNETLKRLAIRASKIIQIQEEIIEGFESGKQFKEEMAREGLDMPAIEINPIVATIQTRLQG